MVKVALFVRLEAKPGKEAAVVEFLRAGLPLVQNEPATATAASIITRLRNGAVIVCRIANPSSR